MAKKKPEGKTEKTAVVPAAKGADPPADGERAAAARTAPRKRAPRRRSKATAAPPQLAAPRDFTEARFQALLAEIRSIKELVQPHAPRRGAGASADDPALESSVDSLRRLLSELIEQRMETVVTDLVDIRNRAVAVGGGNGTDLVTRLDDLLENLGARRFAAEPMDIVDPLIHAIIEERRQPDAPDGVILQTVRPGLRTARGLVLCKAAVAVNRRG